VFAALAPGIAVSLGLARGANIGEAMDYGLDFRRKSPFDTVQMVALAQVSDRLRLAKAMERIASLLPQLGARAERNGDDFQVTYAAGRGARFGVREIEGKPVAYLMGGRSDPRRSGALRDRRTRRRRCSTTTRGRRCAWISASSRPPCASFPRARTEAAHSHTWRARWSGR